MQSLKEYNKNEYVKLTYSDNADQDYQFSEGLNDAGNEFITFYRYRDLNFWFRRYFDAHIWRVKIPEGEKIYEGENRILARRVILYDCRKFYEIDELCQLAVSSYPFFMEYVKTKTPYLCHLAIINRNYPYVRHYIDKYGLVDVEQYLDNPGINFMDIERDYVFE